MLPFRNKIESLCIFSFIRSPFVSKNWNKKIILDLNHRCSSHLLLLLAAPVYTSYLHSANKKTSELDTHKNIFCRNLLQPFQRLGKDITQKSRQIIRQRGTADAAEQCMDVVSTNKNTALVNFTAMTNFRPLAPVLDIKTRQWRRLGSGSISDDTIISYFLTLSPPQTTPGRMSCGQLNENKQEMKVLWLEWKFIFKNETKVTENLMSGGFSPQLCFAVMNLDFLHLLNRHEL